MSSINQQGTANPLSLADQLLIWSSANGDTRKTSITALLALLLPQVPAAVPGVSTPAVPVFLPFVGGTNAIIASAAVGVTIPAPYIGQTFDFFPVGNNTGAITLQVGTNAAINVFRRNAACTGGEFRAGTPVKVAYDGVQYQIVATGAAAIQRDPLVNSLLADVNLNNPALYFDGPSVAQGTTGKFFASGGVTVLDSAGTATIFAKLWDGATVMDAATIDVSGANKWAKIALSGWINNPAANIRISVSDGTSANGQIKFNGTGTGKDSTLTVQQIG